jgi:hypothetical protein
MLVARRSVDQDLALPGDEATAGPQRAPGNHAYLVAPGIALIALVITFIVGDHYGIDLRDPDGVIGSRLLLLLGVVLLFWALDFVPRALLRSDLRAQGLWTSVRMTLHERWTWRRVGIVLSSILAFYITYLCYRNFKSFVPLARPGLQDAGLGAFERSVFGADPAEYLHAVLGTGAAAYVLSTVYVLFLAFVPVSLGFALVWNTRTSTGLWWVSALSLNWVLGALSYFLIPSLGPAFTSPELFTQLPETGVTALQQALLETRERFLDSPVGSGALNGVAAFASLHVSIVFTGAIMAHFLRAPRPIRIGMWIFLVLTVLATIYFGWHYVVDDLAGFAIGAIAVWASARLTGWRIELRPSGRAVRRVATR